MPTYERWKYCGAPVEEGSTKLCGQVAEAECSGVHHPGIPHAEDVKGWAEKPKEVVNHPRFVCAKHLVED